MNTDTLKSTSVERTAGALNGWAMLILNLAMLFGAAIAIVLIAVNAARTSNASIL